MPGAVVEDGATVEYAIISEKAVIKKRAHVGARPENYKKDDQWGIAVIGEGVTIAEGCVVAPKAMVDTDVVEVADNEE